MTRQNFVFSQPYYSRHPYLHLRRGEVKPFLQAWYDTMAAMADRDTYTFTEHFFGASPHKTHEEAWFLMETRWMLYLEEGQTLRLLTGVPRAYLEDGKTVAVAGWLRKGLPRERIVAFPRSDNFWGPAGETGPCGGTGDQEGRVARDAPLA